MELIALSVVSVVLGAVILVLLHDRAELQQQNARERDRLVNAVIARQPRDLAALNHEPRVRPTLDPAVAEQPRNPAGM